MTHGRRWQKHTSARNSKYAILKMRWEFQNVAMNLVRSSSRCDLRTGPDNDFPVHKRCITFAMRSLTDADVASISTKWMPLDFPARSRCSSGTTSSTNAVQNSEQKYARASTASASDIVVFAASKLQAVAAFRMRKDNNESSCDTRGVSAGRNGCSTTKKHSFAGK